MKIGIITFHNAVNYGAVLQCFALQKYLQLKKHTVEIVDYKNEKLLECYKPIVFTRLQTKNPFKFVKRLLHELKWLKYKKARNKKFAEFVREFFVCSKSIDLVKENYDLLIIGSDQVWNTKLTDGFDKFYWGNFPKKKNTRLISYAASIEQFWPKEKNREAFDLLSRFDDISVREATASDCLAKLLNKRVYTCVDPTLLLPPSIWNDFCDECLSVKKPYLLLYQVRNTDFACEVAKYVAKQKNLGIISLSAAVETLNSKNVIDSSPAKFVSLFKHADFVVSSSFHGTVFSVIFKKNFYSIKLGDGRDSRAENLLTLLHLSDRMISSLPTDFADVNYEMIDDDLNKLSHFSKEYLDKYV